MQMYQVCHMHFTLDDNSPNNASWQIFMVLWRLSVLLHLTAKTTDYCTKRLFYLAFYKICITETQLFVYNM